MFIIANRRQPYAMGHKDDFAIGPLVAILAPFHNTLVPNATLSSLLTFPGTHMLKTSAFSPPYDTYPRNITAWISPNLTIGAESFSENVIGGPAKNPNSFNPAVVQWARKDGSVGWLTLYAEVMALDVKVDEASLELAYPQGNSTSRFSFLVGTNGWDGKRDVSAWSDVEGVSINATGSVSPNYTVTFNGLNGGAGSPIKYVYHNLLFELTLLTCVVLLSSGILRTLCLRIVRRSQVYAWSLSLCR